MLVHSCVCVHVCVLHRLTASPELGCPYDLQCPAEAGVGRMSFHDRTSLLAPFWLWQPWFQPQVLLPGCHLLPLLLYAAPPAMNNDSNLAHCGGHKKTIDPCWTRPTAKGVPSPTVMSMSWADWDPWGVLCNGLPPCKANKHSQRAAHSEPKAKVFRDITRKPRMQVYLNLLTPNSPNT